MPTSIIESTSPRKSINVEVVPSPTGVTVSGSVRWFDTLYTIPATVVPCAYVDDETYRVVLASTPPRLALVENGTVIADEVCYLARWAFSAPTDTCATVTIEVPHRTLVQRPPTITDVPIMGLVPKPVLDADGNPVLDENGEPVVQMVERQIGTEQVTTPAPSLPPPTVHAVSTTVVVPAQMAERRRERKLRQRIRALRQQARDMKQAGTTYAAMTTAQRQIIGELVALDPAGEVPMEIP